MRREKEREGGEKILKSGVMKIKRKKGSRAQTYNPTSKANHGVHKNQLQQQVQPEHQVILEGEM